MEILRVARDLYERSGRVDGHDLDNWLEAERLVRTLRKIAWEDGKRYIQVNVPRPGGEEEGEYSKWMIKFFER
ncbi:MAG: DUF2934 domain-containing protein [Nitrospirota bacterium]